MMRRRGFVGALGAAGAAVLLPGCGGGFDDKTKAQLRLVNASGGYTALDLTVGGDRVQSSVPYGGSDEYADVGTSDSDTVITSPGSAAALLTLTPSLGKGDASTLLAYGDSGSLKTLLLDDETDEPSSGRTLLRVVNGAPDAGSLDVYVTTSSDALTAAVPLQSAAAYGTLGEHVDVQSATWRLRVTAAGSKTDVRLDVDGFVLDSREVTTLVLTPGNGGVLVSALLLVDRGEIRRYDNVQARVRAVAAVSGGAAVTVSAGGSTLLNGIAAPAIGSYVLVDAGSATLAVGVAGVALAGPANVELAAGGDYTLLVAGSAGGASVSSVSDDNRLPDDSAMAKVRLVNALAAGTATLAVDVEPIADGVAAGTASGYALVTASTNAELAISVSDGTAIAPLVDQTLVANAVYSVFVTGSSSGPRAILRRDR